jgi:hypothetical protein
VASDDDASPQQLASTFNDETIDKSTISNLPFGTGDPA